MKISVSLTIILLLIQTDTKTFDFGPFEITGPSSWTINNVQGIDSYVKEIITESGDTLSFDWGYYSNSLEESTPHIDLEKYIDHFLSNGVDTTGMIFLRKDSLTEQDLENQSKQFYEYKIIDGFKARIVTPKSIGKGITGVYFDSLANGTIGNVKLNFYGIDLNDKDHKNLLKAIHTIKIK